MVKNIYKRGEGERLAHCILERPRVPKRSLVLVLSRARSTTLRLTRNCDELSDLAIDGVFIGAVVRLRSERVAEQLDDLLTHNNEHIRNDRKSFSTWATQHRNLSLRLPAEHRRSFGSREQSRGCGGRAPSSEP